MSVHLLASSISTSNICTAPAPFLPSEPTRSWDALRCPPPPTCAMGQAERPSPWAQPLLPQPVRGTGYKKSCRDSGAGAVAIASHIVQANDY